ncbi:MAG: hypothetical protein J3R72DRAFT_460872 [Linnemannia gamsii]|nr:MAG: hypothetical protein J3R72DRAFT_460872 [Linnemannia gamsii]
MNTRLLANVHVFTAALCVLDLPFLTAGPDSLLFRVVGPFFVSRFIEVITSHSKGYEEINFPKGFPIANSLKRIVARAPIASDFSRFKMENGGSRANQDGSEQELKQLDGHSCEWMLGELCVAECCCKS